MTVDWLQDTLTALSQITLIARQPGSSSSHTLVVNNSTGGLNFKIEPLLIKKSQENEGLMT